MLDTIELSKSVKNIMYKNVILLYFCMDVKLDVLQ
jgi:hypothetical protein